MLLLNLMMALMGLWIKKTSEARDEQAAFYSRQLSANAYALEHPAPRHCAYHRSAGWDCLCSPRIFQAAIGLY